MIDDPAHDALFLMENHPLVLWIYHFLTMATYIPYLLAVFKARSAPARLEHEQQGQCI